MGTRSPLTLLALLGLCLQGCATPGLPANSSVCGVPEFAYSDGWLGGDAAYSVPLGTGRSLWLFGDTFVGSGDQDTRAGAHFVHNSIAISECRAGGEWEIEYFWTRAREDQPPGAFLDTAARDRYWWLFGGLLHQSVLYLGLLEVEQSEPRGPLNLPFRYTGMKLARVANPDAPPAQWKIDVLPLSSNPIAFPASAMAVDGNHLYLFTFIDRDATRYPRILTRLPLEALTRETRDLSGRLETLTRGGTWQPGLDVENAQIVMDDNASEMSVRFHVELGKWIAVYNYPDLRPGFPESTASDVIWLRTATRLEGPWSSPRVIYQIPELRNDDVRTRDPNTFCYAAKEHPQLARAGTLLLTYVCNLFTPRGEDPYGVLERLLERMDLYRPQPVVVPLPAATASQ